MCPADPALEGLQFKDPYEKFMYQHLQYYGYFRGERNIPQGIPFLSESKEESSLHMLKPDIFGKRSTSEHNSDKNLLCSVASETARLKSKQLLLNLPDGPSVLRLREPRNLSSLPNGRDSVLTPFWPIECEVIEDSIHHIGTLTYCPWSAIEVKLNLEVECVEKWTPPEPEPFYQPTGNEYAPDVVGEEHGTVVYSIEPAAKGTCFTGSRVGGSREPIKPAAPCPRDPEDTMLLFESRFESGNLQKAVRVGKYEYELTLRTDLYTSKHTQWYYFRVQNTRKDVTYRFTIVNLMKAKSLYSIGMKPLLYSQKDAQLHGVGWIREGSDIKYYKYNTEDGQTLYCLTWTMSFRHSHDTCYFAHFYPYTYSDLQRYLLTLVNNPVCSQYCKLRPLCSSLAGNTVYLLTITNPSKSAAASAAKKAIVLSARVHPGETNSSWVMRGFLDFILSDAPDAQLLRDLFIFKIVPMLNPDGVIVGNYRCSLAGRDLNRNYRTLLKESFPCIWYTRAMVKRVLEEREILLYCDLHGHSRKNNVFMYGCNNKRTKELLFHERIFPLMLSKNIPDKFSFNSCKFRVQKCKEGTGRVVMWRMGILNSYTMESTFSGSTLGRKSNSHFTSEDLKTLGYHICDTLLDFCDPDHSKFQQCLSELKELMKQKIQRKLSELGHEQNTDGTWSDISLSDVESSTSGSDSSQSDGPPAHLISMIEKDYNEKKKKKKNKHLRTRKERNNLHQNHAQRHSPKDKEDVPASTISPSYGKCHSLSKGSQRNINSEQKRKQMNRVIFMYQAQHTENSVCSSLQRENLNNFQKFQEPPLGKQIIPMFQYEMNITTPQPLLITTISPLRQCLPKPLVKQHPSPIHGQPNGELHGKKNPGLSIPSPSPGLKRHRSLLCYPEVPSMTLMLRRSLALKFQSPFENSRLWHMSQSRSQIISHGEFKWKPLQIDSMLLRTESRYHAKGKGPSSKMEQKHSLLKC